MKARNLREQTDEELRNTHEDAVRAMSDIRAKQGIGDASEQPLKIRTLRRDLARIKTVMHERELKGDG